MKRVIFTYDKTEVFVFMGAAFQKGIKLCVYDYFASIVEVF